MDASKKKKKPAPTRTQAPAPAKPAQKPSPQPPSPSPAATKKVATPAKPSQPSPPAAPIPAPEPARKASKSGTSQAPASTPSAQSATAPSPASASAKVTTTPPVVARAAAVKPTTPTQTPAPTPGKSPATPAAPASSKSNPAPTSTRAPLAPPPSILLEGDTTPAVSPGGPGGRYVLAPGGAQIGSPATPTELPTSYGTGRLLLFARDPHWVYAHWDLTDAQLREANKKSASGALVLRIRAGAPEAAVVVEQAVHPESKNWFIHVPQAGVAYLGELGYYNAARTWVRISVSAPTLTPRNDLSEETWVRFETLPFELPMAAIVALVKEALSENTPLLEALRQLRAEGHPELSLLDLHPAGGGATPGPWTEEQERALAQLLSMDEVRRVWIGSLEITELLRRQLQRGLSSASLPLSLSSLESGRGAAAPGLGSLSSPLGGEAQPPPRGFWFNVNAELIVYGATDPQAAVTIGNRSIRLRPDGTFTYRFALPDGEYALPITATSPDAVEQRQANLSFSRASEYRGDVPAHPQDPTLRTPKPDHVA